MEQGTVGLPVFISEQTEQEHSMIREPGIGWLDPRRILWAQPQLDNVHG